MGVSGAAGVAGVVLAAELCAPLLLLCGLCCWGDDASDGSSSGGGSHPKRPVVAHESGGRRRSSEVFSRRAACSVASLHLPSTSGSSKQQLAHRSHEEIPRRASGEDARYHSAPNVLHEVLHRRDWERSTKELYIPLKPENALEDSDDSPAAPHAEPESSSVECLREDRLTVPCKKHYTNIKTSKNRTKKESINADVKDTDATEDGPSNFYIGESKNEDLVRTTETQNMEVSEEKIKSVYKAKDDKQSFNESIRAKKPFITLIDDDVNMMASLTGYRVKMLDLDLDQFVDELDRDGAMNRVGSQSSLLTCVSRNSAVPRSSVETVGYEGGACYLAEAGRSAALARVPGLGTARARHASDGDILAPTLRPESGAFSESDLELELESCEERPPAYHELAPNVRKARQETAI